MFDSIDVKTLIAEAKLLGFPLMELALSLAVHHAPSRLKLGKALGEAIAALGCSIIAVCKRSTSLARVYTLLMVDDLDKGHPSVELHIHVDDVPNEVKADGDKGLIEVALDYSVHFKEHTDRLSLTISDELSCPEEPSNECGCESSAF